MRYIKPLSNFLMGTILRECYMFFRILFCGLLLWGPWQSARGLEDNPLPFPLFHAEYELYAFGLHLGDATRSLTRAGDKRFVFYSDSQTTGLLSYIRDDRITETSVWEYHQGEVRPLKYTYHHSGSKKQRHEEVIFDWENQIARGMYRGESWQDPLDEGELDPSVYQIALMKTLLENEPGDMEYQVPYKGKFKPFPLKFEGRETIDTVFGELETVKFMHRGDNKERISRLWCAPDLYYLPVRVSHTEPGGETITMHIESLRGIKPPRH